MAVHTVAVLALNRLPGAHLRGHRQVDAGAFTLRALWGLDTLAEADTIILPTDDGNLEPLLRWMEENTRRNLNLGEIATQATMSTRTLNRHVRAQTGTTPIAMAAPRQAPPSPIPTPCGEPGPV
jgi:hypothetical protein